MMGDMRVFTIAVSLSFVLLSFIAPGLSRASGTCTTSAKFGICGPYALDPSGVINNNIWGLSRDPSATQTLTASSAGSWNVNADMGAGIRSVISYPEVQQNYPAAPYTAHTSMLSAYSESMNPNSGTIAEAAYDIWLGDPSHGSKHWEMMIWTDNHNQRPAGRLTGSMTIDGVSYQVWDATTHSGTDPHGLVSLVRASTASGSEQPEHMVSWLVSRGWYPGDIQFDQVDYGWEICSTGNVHETFVMTHYSLSG